MKESRRFYPNKELAAHLLGYVGIDNVGLSGIEAAYDKVVRGQEGKLLVQTDARGTAFSRLERAPTAGGSLELTIDEQLQYIVERELRAGVEEKRADGGTAVVMDPHTGEILAMANWPTFNPNVYRRRRGERPAQPRGAGHLRAGLDLQGRDRVGGARREADVTPTTMIDTSPGIDPLRRPRHRRVRGTRLRRAVVHRRDRQVEQRRRDQDRARESAPSGWASTCSRFGFGRPTSPDFPARARASSGSAKLNDSALASVSMGYQVGVTPLQMAAAMSAVANGGTLDRAARRARRRRATAFARR